MPCPHRWKWLAVCALAALAAGCSSAPEPDPLDGLGLHEARVVPADPGLPGEFVASGNGGGGALLRLNAGGTWDMETPSWKLGIEEASGIWRRRGDRLALFYGEEASRTAENWSDLRAWKPSDGVIAFRVLSWGGRTYLVDDPRARQFAAAVDSGAEPRKTENGEFFMGRGDAMRRTEGPPPFPEDWKALLSDLPTGEYTRGGFGGGSYELHDDGTWLYEDSGCLGLNSAKRGDYTCGKDIVILEVHEAVTEPAGHNDDPVWKPSSGTITLNVVRWGRRSYLVEPGTWLRFVNAVNQGYEPRRGFEGFVLLRVRDEWIPVTGAPPVPEEWRAWILPEPLKGSLVDVLPDGTGVCTLGEKQGVRKGMVFLAQTPGTQDGVFVRVASVQEDRCFLAGEYDDQPAGFTEGMEVLSKFAPDEEHD